ncbi:MAG TPA: phosphatase PAP2 family protein [Patescibacteria group bacterium]|nr:phosphatase PAP2 family protein [Patescibacteria group bacterium]
MRPKFRIRSRAYALLETPLAVAAVVATAVFLAVVLDFLLGGPIALADLRLAYLVKGLRTGAGIDAMKAVTFFASGLVADLVIAASCAAALLRRRPFAALAVLAGYLSLMSAVFFFKDFLGRARPDAWLRVVTESYGALPSGHAAAAAYVCSLLAYAAARRWPGPRARAAFAAAAGAVLLIDASRVYLGVHWLGDVVAGDALGVAFAVGAVAGVRLLERPGRAVPRSRQVM